MNFDLIRVVSELKTPVPSQQTPCLDVEPRLGQSDLGILAWIRLNVKGGTTNRNAPGLYAKALYDLRPKLRDDPAGFRAWDAGLTDRQRELIETSRKRNDADPKVQAKRERERQNLKALRNSDPDYQKKLSDDRIEYAAMIEASEGRSVRRYTDRTKKPLSAAEKQASQKERTQQLNSRLQSEIIAGRNPFDVSKYRSFEAMKNFKQDTMKKQVARYQVCAALIDDGEFKIEDDVICLRIIDMIQKEMKGIFAPDLDLEEAMELVIGSVNSLRAAGVIQKSGQMVRLHSKIMEARAARDQAQKERAALAGC